MPDPYERHARAGGWDAWGPVPPRSQARAAAAAEDLAPAKRPPGRKDPVLCKAAHWKGPHAPELRVREHYWRKSQLCGWGTSYLDNGRPVWNCSHEEHCAGCGKVLRTSVSPRECPYFHEITETEIAEIQADYAERARLLAATRRRIRPVVTGPQGYRKSKREKE